MLPTRPAIREEDRMVDHDMILISTISCPTTTIPHPDGAHLHGLTSSLRSTRGSQQD